MKTEWSGTVSEFSMAYVLCVRCRAAQTNDEGVGGAPHLRERTGPESAPVHNRGLSLRAFDPLPNRLGAAQGWEQDKGGN